MRRSYGLFIGAIALAACGLDVVGVGPAAEPIAGVDSGKSSSSGSASSSSSGSTPSDAGIDVFVPPFDAGAAEIVLDGIEGLTSIAIAGNRLVVGRADLEALTLDLGPGGKTSTLPKVLKARALLADKDEVYFVAQLDADSGNVGHVKADGSTGIVHANEPPGRDVFFEGALQFGSYSTRVVSYTANDMGNIQNRSDNNGAPMGVVATADDVYWADDATGTVWRDSRKDANPQIKVVDGLIHPSALAVIGTAIYVATATDIQRVTPSTEVLAGGLSKPMALKPDVAMLYWIDASAGFLKRKATDSAAPVETIGTLATFAEWRPKLIDFKDADVYWGSPNEGRVYRRKK